MGDLSGMDFFDRVGEIARRLNGRKATTTTEEATKHALIMPVLMHVLEYNVFDPDEVCPEYVCDVGTKKGERVDYVIKRDGVPVILIECKRASVTLDRGMLSQLYRYFSVSSASVAVLTNGLEWRFYSDLKESNILDDEPFFVFSFEGYSPEDVKALKKYCKGEFSVKGARGHAVELDVRRRLRDVLTREIKSPSRDFLRLVAKQVYSSPITGSVLDRIRPMVHETLEGLVVDGLKEALRSSSDVVVPSVRKRSSPKCPVREASVDGVVLDKPSWRGLVEAVARVFKARGLEVPSGIAWHGGRANSSSDSSRRWLLSASRELGVEVLINGKGLVEDGAV